MSQRLRLLTRRQTMKPSAGVSLRRTAFSLTLLAVLTGCDDEQIFVNTVVPPDQPRTFQISVTGVASPLAIDPDPVRVRPRDKLIWTHPSADSVIIDLSRVPATPTEAFATLGDSAVAAITRDAPPGIYKYTVTIVIAGQPIVEDPEVIVEEEEEEGIRGG